MKIKPSYIVIIVLVALLLISNLWNKPKIDTKVVTTTDTIFITRIDTFIQYKPKVIQTIIKDTIIAYLPNGDTTKLYNQQKYYSEKNKYDIWISGYEPNLDSVKVFNRIEEKIITNTITNTIYKERWNWYLETGINSIGSDINPTIGIRLTMPNNFGIGANIGVFNNKATYGFSINYKIR